MPDRISSRERVCLALQHVEPDRVPVDFLATPEIWGRLVERLALDASAVGPSEYFDPVWEAVLRQLEVDCRTVSYDQFCQPPDATFRPGATVSWWEAPSRSLPNRMWRQRLRDGTCLDIWGHHTRVCRTSTGAYEEFSTWPLGKDTSTSDLRSHPWPQPDWWDLQPLPGVIGQLNQYEKYHLRFRIGSVFETAWQLRGLEQFLVDLALDPSIPLYIMDRVTEVHVENLRRALELAGDQLEMVYFYDDVATQTSLMISKAMWRRFIRPRHLQIIQVAKDLHKQVMYHADGSMYALLPELIDMGVNVLNPVQANAKDMEPRRLKEEFGARISFHGGIDIVETLPRGTTVDVEAEVRRRVGVLGKGGGYILASSHHIQPDTPLENVLAMYDVGLRYREASPGLCSTASP